MPMFPATTVVSPAAMHSAPVSAVTVDLPFDPVIAITFCASGNSRAKISMSPMTGMRCLRASANTGW